MLKFFKTKYKEFRYNKLKKYIDNKLAKNETLTAKDKVACLKLRKEGFS